MTSITNPLKDSVIEYCAHIGADPMLVQGGGGNVSWKDGETLWIKASGTCLADASRKEIFVPVELTHLQRAIASGDFQVSPKVCGGASLRPSIEALLHALMPHKVVVHLHAVEILARLVHSNSEAEIRSLVGNSLRWLSVGYFKPGADLAKAIGESMKKTPDVEVVFLKSHGVVIGGADVEAVDNILRKLVIMFNTPPRRGAAGKIEIPRKAEIEELGYWSLPGCEITQLALDRSLFRRVQADWALYPDHVVFLGPKACCFDNVGDFISTVSRIDHLPALVFVRDVGVFASEKLSDAQKAQVQCYAAVMVRQSDDENLDSLTDEHIAQLLDWEAEKYRMNLFIADA